MKPVAKRRLLIVGGGMAAAYLLQELASYAHDLDITVISAEPDACYNRVMLSGVLAGEQPEQALSLLPEADGVTRVLPGTRVLKLDTRNRQLVTDSGLRLPWDELVLAVGATTALPDMPGLEAAGVAVFRSLADTRRLRASAPQIRRAVVVGGGLLGLEAAHGLNRLGCHTTVVHRQPWLMNRQLDPEGGRQLQALLVRRGLEFRVGSGLAEIELSRSRLAGARLVDGERLPCDLLVFATGIRPNTALATSAGLPVDRGVQVDPWMATPVASISALGECCQLGDECFGLVAPIRAQAKVLAARLSNRATAGFVSSACATRLKISGVDIFSMGELAGTAEDLLLHDPAAGIYRRLRLRDDRLVGAVLVGDQQGGNWYSELIHNRSDISALRPGLIFGRAASDAAGGLASAA
ncbi:NAD(P)/FAD-dependent oxidoreductase [Kineobactrum salinum]|uniref:NAD(P)/FAD-dependent oxidoreductase n=1 Tax=Kineobactrum salinum TaxID=2708301 RepID=A0A6C0U2S9_9GAMM|nr:FAD-dependent oxidoreductase [Kineobactrum salinum]QIB65749.1 NAD(P)/FAD-dependent oxidoreductase [Kineobactrum salinum]